MIKEACVGSLHEAILAEKNGADRVELCDNLLEGGTTPSYGCIKMAIRHLNIPIFLMIRPRGGDFCYAKEEIENMKEDILMAKSLGVPGVVFGALTKNKELDIPALEYLMEAAKPMKTTFHKAIDEIEDPLGAIPKLIDLGFDRILTSGKKEKALEGISLLNQMIEKAEGKIIIVAAGKVNFKNLVECSHKIHTDEFHGKQIVTFEQQR